MKFALLKFYFLYFVSKAFSPLLHIPALSFFLFFWGGGGGILKFQLPDGHKTSVSWKQSYQTGMYKHPGNNGPESTCSKGLEVPQASASE